MVASRNVYVCDRDAAGDWGLIMFGAGMVAPQRTHSASGQGIFCRPRGLYVDSKGTGYVVNNPTPFFVRWMMLE